MTATVALLIEEGANVEAKDKVRLADRETRGSVRTGIGLILVADLVSIVVGQRQWKGLSAA